MSELKPCPFCGGDAKIKSRYIGYGSVGLGAHDWFSVSCQECCAKSDEYADGDKAIAAWNRRAAADLIESLQAQLADYHHMSKLVDGKMGENQRLRRINENLQVQLAASQRENKAARNELCLKCGLYHEAHNGACDGCRWKET